MFRTPQDHGRRGGSQSDRAGSEKIGTLGKGRKVNMGIVCIVVILIDRFPGVITPQSSMRQMSCGLLSYENGKTIKRP